MPVYQKLTLTETGVNNDNNTSEVNIKWTSQQTEDSYNDYSRWAKYWVSINGGEKVENLVNYTLPKKTTKTIVDTTITVPHREDGTGTVKVDTYMNTRISAGVVEMSEELTLTAIPRASLISSVAGVILGNSCSVKWTPHSAAFRFKLTFSIGNFVYTTPTIHPNQTTEYTYEDYVIPLEVANYITNNYKGSMTVTLCTYSDSEATVQVGSDDYGSFEITVPDNNTTKPVVSMTLTPVGTLPRAFDGLYIQDRTKVKATLSAEGKFGATIKDYMMMVGGNLYTAKESYTSKYLSEVGVREVNGYAQDSRTFWGDIHQEITVLPYSKPQIQPASDEREIICARCDKDGNLSSSGKYLKIKAKRNYNKVVSDGIQKNFCAIRYRFRSEEQTSFPDGWTTLLPKSDTSTDTIDSAPIEDVVSFTERSYFIQIGVIDEMGESDSVIIPVPSDFTTVDIPKQRKGKRIGLLRYAKETDEPGIDVGAPIYGGSIDSLKLGTLLEGTSESRITLDDIKTPDCYYSPNKETTQYIDGTPEGIEFGFGLEVRELQSENNILQTLRYGVTTWLRHYNGTEWSRWVCSHNTTSGTSASADFVVDSGKSGVWNYRLWNGGEAELWGLVTLDTFGDVRHIKGTFGLPFPFTEYPTVIMNLTRATAFSFMQGAIVLTDDYAVGESVIDLIMIRSEGGLEKGDFAWVNVIIKGKWK